MEALAQLLPIALILGAFYLLAIRPQRARLREVQRTQSALTAGRRIVTTAGLHATVVAVGDDTVELEIAPGVVCMYLRASVLRVLDAPSLDVDGGPLAGDVG